MASIRKVAKEAGVSISTVSRVINGHSSVAPRLRNRVMAAIDRCEYSPAVGRRSTDSIGLVYAGPFTPGSPYDSACIDGMVESMRGSSYDLAIVDIKRDKLDEESYRQFFARKGICGVIVRSTAADRAIVSTMAEQGCQMVVLGDHFPDQRVAFVHGSSYGASTEAVEHLISLGHQRIAFSASESDDGDHCDRFAAYCDALRRAGLYDEDLVCRVPPHRLDGAQLLRKLMAMVTPPTAILIGDPHIAVGVVNEAHQLRINLPTELSIVGFDDNDTRSSLFPRMTAVCQDSRMLGQLAFATLLRILGGEATPLSPAPHHAAWLEINSTTGPAPKVQSRVLTNGVRLPVETI